VKNYCELCEKHCKYGEELCSDEEIKQQYNKLVNILKGEK